MGRGPRVHSRRFSLGHLTLRPLESFQFINGSSRNRVGHFCLFSPPLWQRGVRGDFIINDKQLHIPSITPPIFSKTSLSENLRTFIPISEVHRPLSCPLPCQSQIVLSAVKLYHKIGLRTVKINDILPDNLLAVKRMPLQLLSSQF